MILVDDRTGSAEIAPFLSSPNVVCRLPFADFAWSGFGPTGPVDVGVERKSLLDLLQSMSSGRLSGHQLVGLTQHYDWVFLLVEGVWRADRRNGMLMRVGAKGKWIPAAQGSRRFMARDVWAFFHSLSIICGLQVVTTGSRWETARWLDASHGWWSKGWEKHKSHLQFHRQERFAHLTKPSLATRVWSQFEGIGWDKARKLAAHFPSMDSIMAATREELEEVEGIGPKMAESIINQRRQYADS